MVLNFKVRLQVSKLAIKDVLCMDLVYSNPFQFAGCTAVYVADSNFTNNYFTGPGVIVSIKSSEVAIVQFVNCRFVNNIINFKLISVIASNMGNYSTVHLASCLFQNNANSEALVEITNLQVIISNSIFHNNANASVLLQVNFKYDTIEVNKKYVKSINKSGSYNMVPQTSDQKTLCLCKDLQLPDCTETTLGYLYPGQQADIFIYDNSNDSNLEVKIIIESTVDQSYISPCLVDTTDHLKYIDNTCTRVNFTITFPTDNSCAVFLRIASDPIDYVNILYINQLQCPLGFVKKNRKCCCDPHLVQAGVLACNINEQSILHPADSWISATITTNKSTYKVSLHCAYCLPYPSHLNLLSATNSQCQYDRSGTLCGQCQQGLSTIFASLQCEKCSSIHLYLIVPIAIAGLVLIILLFLLNLTVTDGTINAFILYANITGINASVLLKSSTLVSTLTSLANLDLGIQTCFYNGMDDYAKMWLQLAFPFYLIFIATSLIITSRYSTTIQRLTARRALLVLATLFLLSYTKILHTVSIVLLSYSTIARLPGEQSTIVWSVDTNIPLLIEYGLSYYS